MDEEQYPAALVSSGTRINLEIVQQYVHISYWVACSGFTAYRM
jgi:hypothetical protein